KEHVDVVDPAFVKIVVASLIGTNHQLGQVMFGLAEVGTYRHTVAPHDSIAVAVPPHRVLEASQGHHIRPSAAGDLRDGCATDIVVGVAPVVSGRNVDAMLGCIGDDILQDVLLGAVGFDPHLHAMRGDAGLVDAATIGTPTVGGQVDTELGSHVVAVSIE